MLKERGKLIQDFDIAILRDPKTSEEKELIEKCCPLPKDAFNIVDFLEVLEL